MSSTSVQYGPNSWKEHRNHEGLTMSIDVVLEGYIQGDDEVKITKEFNWIIPDEHKTMAYWHPSGGVHPITGDSVHNEINDNNYSDAYTKWFEYIEVSEPFNKLSMDMHTYLGSLTDPVYHDGKHRITEIDIRDNSEENPDADGEEPEIATE